jgi:hypothetical protein
MNFVDEISKLETNLKNTNHNGFAEWFHLVIDRLPIDAEEIEDVTRFLRYVNTILERDKSHQERIERTDYLIARQYNEYMEAHNKHIKTAKNAKTYWHMKSSSELAETAFQRAKAIRDLINKIKIETS